MEEAPANPAAASEKTQPVIGDQKMAGEVTSHPGGMLLVFSLMADRF